MRNPLNTQLGTGAPRERQCAFFTLDRDYRHVSFGCIGRDWMPYDALINSIDAPDVMPAGAMNSTEWTSGAGRPIAHTNETRREDR